VADSLSLAFAVIDDLIKQILDFPCFRFPYFSLSMKSIPFNCRSIRKQHAAGGPVNATHLTSHSL
jgi:hypothetical protein